MVSTVYTALDGTYYARVGGVTAGPYLTRAGAHKAVTKLLQAARQAARRRAAYFAGRKVVAVDVAVR